MWIVGLSTAFYTLVNERLTVAAEISMCIEFGDLSAPIGTGRTVCPGYHMAMLLVFNVSISVFCIHMHL